METDYFQDVTLAEVSLNISIDGSLNPGTSEKILVEIISFSLCYFLFLFHFNPTYLRSCNCKTGNLWDRGNFQPKHIEMNHFS